MFSDFVKKITRPLSPKPSPKKRVMPTEIVSSPKKRVMPIEIVSSPKKKKAMPTIYEPSPKEKKGMIAKHESTQQASIADLYTEDCKQVPKNSTVSIIIIFFIIYNSTYIVV